ncbi:MAG: TetR/AcrR family transcriptional regulator [Pseudomonadales bacterium]
MPAYKARNPRGGDDENGQELTWQAQKSAMTREKILDATIKCFIKLGYANVTTAKVASAAGVSRGAMLNHFPSKTDLIRAATEHLHSKLLADFSKRVQKIPSSVRSKKRRRAGLDAYWDYLSSDLFMAYHELCVEARTDPDLMAVLETASADFDRHSLETAAALFKDWATRGERFLLAMDLTKSMMEGMAVGQMVTNRDKRVRRLLDYLADRLEEIFKEAGPSAIGRHSRK